jgi:hypothetical protein
MSVIILRPYRHPWRDPPKKNWRAPHFCQMTTGPTWCMYVKYTPKAWWVQCESGAKLITNADLAHRVAPRPGDNQDAGQKDT